MFRDQITLTSFTFLMSPAIDQLTEKTRPAQFAPGLAATTLDALFAVFMLRPLSPSCFVANFLFAWSCFGLGGPWLSVGSGLVEAMERYQWEQSPDFAVPLNEACGSQPVEAKVDPLTRSFPVHGRCRSCT